MSSSVNTGIGTVTAATLAPLVIWALNGLPRPIPDEVPYLIAAAIATIGHAAWNIGRVWLAKRGVLLADNPEDVIPPKP